MSNELIPLEIIQNKIYLIRSQKVMLDSDLAELYGVETKMLNRSVKRNLERFSEEFMFQLLDEELESLRCQFGTSKETKGGRRYNPYVFTEYGVVMLSSILNSKRAIAVNIQVVKVFVKLKKAVLINTEIMNKIEEIEKRVSGHDEKFEIVIDAIRQILNPPEEPKKQIGFRVE